MLLLPHCRYDAGRSWSSFAAAVRCNARIRPISSYTCVLVLLQIRNAAETAVLIEGVEGYLVWSTR
jgi:hypothetical protein